MDEEQNTFFHLPVDKDSESYIDAQIVKTVSTIQPGVVRYTTSGADDESRRIYDELLKGEIPPEKKPNGQLFRDTLPDGQTLRIGNATKTVHVPPTSELDAGLE